MMGRAGRPKYDDMGESWRIARDNGTTGEDNSEQLAEVYLHGNPESIESKLSNFQEEIEHDSSFLTHVL